MSELLEAIMVVSFGASWPLNIRKSWIARTTKGKSLFFLILVEFGYVCGILSKIIAFATEDKPITYVFVFYVLNLIMVGTDIAIYFRNKKLDNESGQ